VEPGKEKTDTNCTNYYWPPFAIFSVIGPKANSRLSPVFVKRLRILVYFCVTEIRYFITVVHDEEPIRKALTRRLQSAGLAVKIAGISASELTRITKTDLSVTD
jgi:hypothetical protein